MANVSSENNKGLIGDGYEILCDVNGARIEVIEYHVEPLPISWDRGREAFDKKGHE